MGVPLCFCFDEVISFIKYILREANSFSGGKLNIMELILMEANSLSGIVINGVLPYVGFCTMIMFWKWRD